MRQRTFLAVVTVGAAVLGTVVGMDVREASALAPNSRGAPDYSGTARQRKELFEGLLRDTLAWEAFSPRKNKTLELDFAVQAEELRRAFLKADKELLLYNVLLHFSNLRCNHALRPRLLDDGLRLDRDHQELPVRFGVGEGSGSDFRLFIRDHDVDIRRKLNTISPRITSVEAGDVLVDINGSEVPDVLAGMQPFLSYSTTRQLWSEFARCLSLKRHDLGHRMFKKDVTFGLQKANGKGYRLRVSFIDETHTIDWAVNWDRHHYSGFERALQTPSFDVYLPSGGVAAEALIVEGREFTDDTGEDVDKLRTWAVAQGVLHYNVVFDLSAARGSVVPWTLLQTLVDQPVLVTQATLRLSDVTPSLISRLLRSASPALKTWLVDVVRPAQERGVDMVGPVPYGMVLPPDTEGILDPAEVHFTGGRSALIAASSSPAVNHLAAMWVDNGLGASHGVAPFGCANAWQWRAPISLPRSDRPLVDFLWNVGHVIRPNGEVLEGNPPQPTDPVPVTAGNFQSWHSKLVDQALRGFTKEK